MGMENFEQFRKQTADKVKDLPKSVRGEALEAIKKEDPKKYQEAKKLKEAKVGLLELSKTETLVDPENLDQVASWIKSELDTYTEGNNFVMSYHLEDMFDKIAQYLAKRLNIKTKDLKIDDIAEHNETITYPEKNPDSDNGTAEGSFSLMGEKVLDYKSMSDGYNFEIKNWLDENLKTATSKLIEYLKNQSQ